MPSGTRKSNCWPFGPAIAATAADYLSLSIITPALPFYLSEVGVSEADLPRWNGMIMGAQFAAVMIGNLLSGKMGDTYGSAAAVKLALLGQVVFFALSAFAPFGVGTPTLAATLLLLTRIGAGISTALVSALLYIFDRAPSAESLLRGVAQYMGTLSCMWTAGCVDMERNRVPASCLLTVRVAEAQGMLPQGVSTVYVRRTRSSLVRAELSHTVASQATGGLIVGFLYDTGALDADNSVPPVAVCMPPALDHLLCPAQSDGGGST